MIFTKEQNLIALTKKVMWGREEVNIRTDIKMKFGENESENSETWNYKIEQKKWRTYSIKDIEREGFPSVDIKLKLGSKAQGKNEAWSKQEGFQMNSYQLTLSLHQEESKTTLE